MISIPGSLSIKSISGRFGNFNVGTLECSIGTFAVKDQTIDQFEEGVYYGSFCIVKISMRTYPANGKIITEQCALLDSIVLSQVEETPFYPEPVIHEQDPLVEDLEVKRQLETQSQLIENAAESNDAEKGLIALSFATNWPLKNTVKIDSTIDRADMRRQKEYLENNGYAFDALTQEWSKITSE